jgi:hypothetical protein
MNEQSKRSNKIGLIICIVADLSIYAIYIYMAVIKMQITTELVIVFQLIISFFTIMIGWYLQLMISQKEYLDNLKNYGFAANRRIKDLTVFIDRQLEIIDQSLLHNRDFPELQSIKEIAHSIKVTLKSSIQDWGDVIGEDLIVLSQYSNLIQSSSVSYAQIYQKGDELPASNEPPQTMKIKNEDLQKKLEALWKSLPEPLKISYLLESDLPREGSKDEFLFSYYSACLMDNSQIVFPTDIQVDSTNKSIIDDDLSVDVYLQFGSMYKSRIAIFKEQNFLGIAENPILGSSIYNNDFTYTSSIFISKTTQPKHDFSKDPGGPIGTGKLETNSKGFYNLIVKPNLD